MKRKRLTPKSPSAKGENTFRIPTVDHDERRKCLIDRIDEMLISVLDQLCSGEEPKLFYNRTTIDTLAEQLETFDSGIIPIGESPGTSNSMDSDFIENDMNNDSGIVDYLEEKSEWKTELKYRKRIVDFKRKNSKNKFILIVRMMYKFRELLVENQTELRRAMFYELQADDGIAQSVTKQKHIDDIVHIVANMLDCPAWAIPLVPSAKGLCAGNLKITLRNKKIIDCRGDAGIGISHNFSSAISLTTSADFVLVVEKDTVFYKLLQENCPQALNCILITGKGYPDMATRMLVTTLANHAKLPVFILVDADPHGIEIFFTYKFGSINHSYEQGNFACHSARWLGVLPSDLDRYELSKKLLTEIELKKLMDIRCRPYVKEEIAEELRILKNGKAGIETILVAAKKKNRNLTSFYIRRKIRRGLYL